jgi:TM2 domain-containing membrane protein YozV
MKHLNKTFATLLATLLGTIGAHRLYLRGLRDPWLWLHLASLPASLLWFSAKQPAVFQFWASPLIVSMLLGQLQALVLGLMSDEKWDARFNPASGKTSSSNWPLAVLLVLTLMVGATGLIAALSRMMDLLLTGGSFG